MVAFLLHDFFAFCVNMFNCLTTSNSFQKDDPFKNVHVHVFFSVLFFFFTVPLHTAPSWQPEVLLQTLRKNSDEQIQTRVSCCFCLYMYHKCFSMFISLILFHHLGGDIQTQSVSLSRASTASSLVRLKQ